MELQPYNLYLRALVPFMMVQLGKDDEAYNFIKFWYGIILITHILFELWLFRNLAQCTFFLLTLYLQKLILGWRTLQNLVIFPSVKTACFLICHSPNIQWKIRTKLKTSWKFLELDWKNLTSFTSPFSYVLSWSRWITIVVRSCFLTIGTTQKNYPNQKLCQFLVCICL